MCQSHPSSARRLITSTGLAVLIGWLGMFAQAPEPVAAQATSPTPIDWTLFSRPCAPPPDALTLDCGDYGIFYLSHTSGSCEADATGTDVPRVYSKPGLEPRFFQEAEPVPAVPGKSLPPPSEGPGMPCEQGSCFASLSTAWNGEPWIAELDWNNWHGWSVGATLSSVSGLPVVLYALDDPELETLLGPGVGDAHVLAQLCAVANAIDIEGSDEPVAINLSFGRYFEPAVDPAGSSLCDSDTLTCQVAKVLRYLDQRGIALVAAAGNYRELEFPAILDEVLAAGALDMAVFTWQHQLSESWESPRSSQILVPGYGICLPYEGPQGEILWPAPAGSSYASALFTAWAAEVLLANPSQHPSSIDWSVGWQDTIGCYTLSNLPPATCNPVANEILERVVSYDQETCWQASVPGEALEILAPQSPLTTSEVSELPSLAEWVSPKHSPSPAPDPCIPCVSEGLSIKAHAAAASGQALVLDASSSSPLADGFFYDQLLLRVDEDHFSLLDRDRGSEGVLLDQLQNAEVSSLVVQGMSGALSRAEQPSLIYIVCESPGDCFWTSVPVLIKGLQ